jgi:hypothetical protein
MIATRAMTGFVVVKSPRWDGRGLQGVQERLLDPWRPRLRPMNCRRLSKIPRFSMFGNIGDRRFRMAQTTRSIPGWRWAGGACSCRRGGIAGWGRDE